MRIIETKNKLCLCCMEVHDVNLVEIEETTTFKGMPVKHIARYEYCDIADELLSDEVMMTSNDIAMKDAYRRANQLLTTDQIVAIRNKYSISQKDLASLLGWGEKTITRYEGHQVQDMAHDFVLRKIDEDPMCFLEVLERRKDSVTNELYGKYKAMIEQQYEKMRDDYLRKSILSEYIKYKDRPELCGDTKLNLDKVVAVINYFAESSEVSSLYKVKLMKLLWYADFLSYKRRQRSITGLVYTSMPMGAVPVAHKSIVNLQGINCEEIEFENGSGMKFNPNRDFSFDVLDEEDVQVLDLIAGTFGQMSKKQIVDRMHEEQAYIETPPGEAINYKHARWLSVEER